MRKLVISFFLLLLIAGCYAWYSVQTLPAWFDERAVDNTGRRPNNQPQLSAVEIKSTGEVINGELILSESEFSMVVLKSLNENVDGQTLLGVSDAIKLFLREDGIELSAIINLDKVEAIDPDARRAIEQVDRIFPFINGHRLALSVYATPIVRDGGLAIKDDFHIKVGALPFSNQTLRGLGVEVERANTTRLMLTGLRLTSLQLRDQKIVLRVTP